MRSIFWNFKEAFFGLPIVKLVPKTFLLYPVGVLVPSYFLILKH